MECIWKGVIEITHTKEKKNVKTFRSVVSNISRLFHNLANANQKEALSPKSCTEVKAERRFLPKVQQSLDCATGEKKNTHFLFLFFI